MPQHIVVLTLPIINDGGGSMDSSRGGSSTEYRISQGHGMCCIACHPHSRSGVMDSLMSITTDASVFDVTGQGFL